MNTKDKILKLYHQNNINLYHKYVTISGYFCSLKPRKYTMYDPIDFVVTWVDGNDPDWRAQKNEYYKRIHPEAEGNGEERYRDWGIFKYWFRAVEKYAPWVRNVYLVTCGHVPEWINRECPKLTIVKHSEFMDEKYLPTFSSIPIELNLHRIEGLSEHFVYFNDDIFLAAPVKPTDFFRNGLPTHCAIAEPVRNGIENSHFPHQLFSCVGLINGKFEPQNYIPKQPELWFSHEYNDAEKLNNWAALKNNYLPGIYFTHLMCPFRKKTISSVWNEYERTLNNTCLHCFRTPLDIMHQIFTYWEIVHGDFAPVPKGYLGTGFNQLDQQLTKIKYAFDNQKYRSICLNDTELISDYENTKKELVDILDSVFPDKSQFEL